MPKPFKIPQSVLVVIYTPAREVLLLLRSDVESFWQSVTGSKDSVHEELRQTAAREVWEETGIDCRAGSALEDCLLDWQLENVFDIYPGWRHRFAPEVSRNTEHLFGLALPGRVAVALDPREHVAYRWLPWQQAADACFSASNAEAVLMLPRFFAQGATS